MSQEKKGIILLFLSDYKDGKSNDYQTDEGIEIISGTQTNDAPVKYLIKKAYENDGIRYFKILCITSKKVYDVDGKEDKIEEIDINNKKIKIKYKSNFERFQKIISGYSKEFKGLKIEVKSLFYDFYGNEKTSNILSGKTVAVHLYQQLIENIGDDETNAYIDYTGGMRDVNFLMVSVMRYLEFKNVECRKIVYSNHATMKIYEINYVYNIFQMINGLNEFVTTGNAVQLEQIFKNMPDHNLNMTSDLIESIVNFSNAMSLCNTDKVAEGVRKIATAIKKFDEQALVSNGQVQTEQDLYLEMFRTMLPLVREKMCIDRIVTNENMIEYPYLILWCLNNKMIQQALTLYVEKMPVYYVKKGIVTIPKNFDCKIPNGATKETAYFYGELFDAKGDKTLCQKFVEQLKQIVAPIENAGEKTKALRNCTDEKFREERNALAKVMTEKYDKYGNCRDEYGKEGRPKKLDGLWNNVMNGTLPREITDKFFQEEGGGTKHNKYSKSVVYTKKVKALQNIERGDDEFYKNLLQRMQYYLAIKFMRNNINHASDVNVMSEDEQKVWDYLIDKNLIKKEDNDYERIRKLLKAGASLDISREDV